MTRPPEPSEKAVQARVRRLTWHLTVWGPPRTKKTHNVLAKAGRRYVVLPSAAWRAWNTSARIERDEARYPIHEVVNCRALFYRDAERGDAVGYYQGLADLLQAHDLVTNDRLIVSWDGSRLLKDATNPRVEVILEPV